MSKVMTAAEAAAKIRPGSTVLIDGSGGGINEPDLLLKAIEERFLSEGQPTQLTIVHPSGMGDNKGGGIDHFAHSGLVCRVIGGHWGWCNKLQVMARDEEIEAYCLPQGVIIHLMQAIAAGRPGVITHIGLGTTVDPRKEGGRLNRRAEGSLVEVIELDGREWLRYKPFPVDVALIRGSVIDDMGNLTMEHEGIYAATLSAAQAARNSGGIVIAQAKYLAQTGTLDPRRVKVPGVLVDAIVIHPNQALSIAVDEDPALSGGLRIPQQTVPQLPLNERKIISRRAAQELRHGDTVNLGFGLADGVAAVLAEEGLSDAVTFTLEQGQVGGIPAAGANFGLARNQYAIVDAAYQFDWYDGGGLDITIISFAQADAAGNVNVSRFGNRIAGVGGFINITQGAKRLVFVGTFTAGKFNFEFGPHGMRIIEDGSIKKFVSEVEQISFNAGYAWSQGRSVKYVTERAVFELTAEGLLLTEIGPDINLESDILNQMAFRPAISPNLRVLDRALFRAGKLGLNLVEQEQRV